MNLVQFFAVCVIVTSIDAPRDVTPFLSAFESAVLLRLDQIQARATEAEPDARISIGIDPLDWIKTNRY